MTRGRGEMARHLSRIERQNTVAKTDALGYNPAYTLQFPIITFQLASLSGEVMELVPVPDFKSGGSWLWSGMVSSILMLSRQE